MNQRFQANEEGRFIDCLSLLIPGREDWVACKDSLWHCEELPWSKKKTLMLNSLKLAVKMCFSYNVFSLRLRRSEGTKTENLTGTLHRKHESFGGKKCWCSCHNSSSGRKCYTQASHKSHTLSTKLIISHHHFLGEMFLRLSSNSSMSFFVMMPA